MKESSIVVILSALLLLILLWKEIRRPDRSYLWLRISATVTAVTMLVLFFIPIDFTRKMASGTQPGLLLLTDGAGNKPDPSPRSKQITTDQRLASPKVEFIPDLSVYVLQHQREIPSIHIHGKGIAEHEWDLLNKLKIESAYTPPATPAGVIYAGWPRMIRQGDRFEVLGTYNNRNDQEVKLILSGLGTAFDSVIISKDSLQTFYLSCQPAHTGRTVYELQTLRNGNPVSTEKIPVTISEPARPAILFLSSSPGFEEKFIARWLHEHNYPAAVRNKISRDKYDHQFLNMKATSLSSFSASLLENFDLLIADDPALSELSSGTTALIKTQLEKGMGLIIQTDTSRPLSDFSRPFSLRRQASQKTATRSLAWAGVSARSSLAAEQWLSIQNDPSAQPLVTDEQQSVITACRLYGSGRVIMNTATSTFSWLLSGNEENYSSFWSLLISRAARIRKPGEAWSTEPAFPSQDHQVKLLLETDSATLPVIKTASGELYTEQTPYLPDTWTANWWPASPGWQTLSCTDTVSIYVFEERDWSAAKQYAQINRNIMLAARQQSTLKKTNTIRTETGSVPVYIFFIVFAGACGILWWEGKR